VNFDQAVSTFRQLFEDAVRLRLISDVPVGTFCSGGVDSSLVTAVAARLKGGPINTYSVGFDENEWDESPYALSVAKHCQTDHHQLNVGNVEYSDLLPAMIWHNDEPLDFANSVHIFALSKLAKEKVTVVLTGEGSDELFGGYPRYRIPDLARTYRRFPAVLRRLLTRLAGDRRLAKLERYANGTADEALLFNSSYLQPAMAAALCPGLPAFASAHRADCLEASNGGRFDDAARVSLLDQESFLVGILHRQDKMSMAASIESRVPFMDYRIVEFANRLPTECKIRGGVGKAIVKQYARTLLPEAIVDRRKSGFGVPLDRWFRSNDGLGARIRDLAETTSTEVFDRATLRRLVDEHRRGDRDHSEILWTALNLATWREAFRC
jgi:asparagine synthase (glutamine-hydrolysing)